MPSGPPLRKAPPLVRAGGGGDHDNNFSAHVALVLLVSGVRLTGNDDLLPLIFTLIDTDLILDLERFADADGLQILLRNLLENAVKYTPAQGRVRLRVRRAGGVTQVVVEDSGPGIAAEQRERMFQRFVRADDAPSTGSGLGLSIARTIAERHGAVLTLGQSDDLGGLLVLLEFPAQVL